MGCKSSPFHSIISGFTCQGGDLVRHNGASSGSKFGERFEGENFVLNHSGPGILSVVSTEQYTNSPQFFICTPRPEWLSGKHMGFGKLKGDMNIPETIRAVSGPGMARPAGRSPLPIVDNSDSFDFRAAYPPDHSFCSSEGCPHRVSPPSSLAFIVSSFAQESYSPP